MYILDDTALFWLLGFGRIHRVCENGGERERLIIGNIPL